MSNMKVKRNGSRPYTIPQEIVEDLGDAAVLVYLTVQRLERSRPGPIDIDDVVHEYAGDGSMADVFACDAREKIQDLVFAGFLRTEEGEGVG